nr:hypothetical protein [Tanacetum cinerariifolium]
MEGNSLYGSRGGSGMVPEEIKWDFSKPSVGLGGVTFVLVGVFLDLGTDAKYQADQTQSAQLSDDEDIIEAGEDMDEDTQADKEEHQSPLKKDKPEPSLAQDTQES